MSLHVQTRLRVPGGILHSPDCSGELIWFALVVRSQLPILEQSALRGLTPRQAVKLKPCPTKPLLFRCSRPEIAHKE